MPAILAINPNTTAAVTALLEQNLRQAAPAVRWHLQSGRFGARYIVSEAAYAIASHAALDAWARHDGACDAVLLACFGDPGLFALRELSAAPVVGLAEASMQEAAAAAKAFSIVTGGPRWKPMLERLSQALGFAPALASVRTTTLTGADAAAEPGRVVAALAAACRAARDEDGAGVVILGGAGFAGLAAQVSDAAGMPVIDSVAAGARAAERLARGAPIPYPRLAPAKPAATSGIDAPLAGKLFD